jgi:hypothetical protein
MAPMQTQRRSRPTDVRARVGPLAATGLLARVGLLAATGLLAACTGAASPATTPATSSPGPPASTAGQTPAAVTLAPGPATVVTVAWGEIWDRLPASFPLPSDAQPAQPADPVEGPSSGAFTTGLGVDEAARGIGTALAGAGWSIQPMTSGEDGSRDISAVGASPGCRSLVTVRPLGSVHFVTAYYGAGCPRP